MSYRVSVSALLLKLFSALALASTLLLSNEPSLVKMAHDPNLQWGGCPPFIGEGCQIAVLHGDPAKSNSDIFFKVPGNFKIPNHWHTSPERMILVSGKLDVHYEKENSQTLSTGDYAYGPAKKPHTAFCHEGDPCIIFIAFEEPIDAFEIK